MKSPLRFASWAAVSSLPQAKKVSLSDQLAENRQHAERHGGVIVAELVVPGESRSITLFEDACRKIDAYAKLRDLIAARAFDVLIFLDRGRLGRIASLSMAVVQLCQDAGIATYETENPPLTISVEASHDEMLIGAIKSVGAQREVQKLRHRHRMGMIARVKRGDFPKAVPWGWTAIYSEDGTRRIVIDEAAAHIIRTIAELYLHGGLGMEAVAAALNEQGYRTKTGALWTLAHVQGIFRLLWRYAGYSEVWFGAEYTKAPGNWPAILQESVVMAIQAERQSRTKRSHSVSMPYLLSRLVVCERHGSHMAVNVHRKNGQIIYQFVRCKLCKPTRYIHFSAVLDVLRTAIAYLLRQANRDEILQALESDDSDIDSQLDALRTQMLRTNDALRRADDAFVAGTMDSERYQRQIERLTAERRRIESEMEAQTQAVKAQQFDASRNERLNEVAELGAMMLAHDDVAAANAWLRHHFIVYALDGVITRVEYL